MGNAALLLMEDIGGYDVNLGIVELEDETKVIQTWRWVRDVDGKKDWKGKKYAGTDIEG